MAGWVLMLAGLMMAGAALAQDGGPELAAPPPPLVLAADAPVPVWVNGLAVQLALSTGTVDHVTLNDESVARIGLSAAPMDNTADLIIGGRAVLRGRHGKGWMAQADALLRREYYWFPGEQRLPLAGTIGPFALPHWRVQVEWPLPPGTAASGAAELIDLPLIGGIDRAAYGVAQVGRHFLAVGLDVRMRRPLPLVTAATGADLAATLGGRFVGEVWREEILLGIARPVRRLVLDRPLMIGPIRIDAVAVRQGGPRDATMSLDRGQITPPDAEEDPEIMAVRGRIIKQRRVARYIMLTRTQVEAAGCTSLLVDKAQQRWQLACALPERAVAAATETAAVPVAAAAEPLIEPVLPALPAVELAVDQPLVVRVDGEPLRLVPGDAGREGLHLNGRVAERLLAGRLQALGADPQWRGQLADALRRSGPADLFDQLGGMALPGSALERIGVASSDVAPRTVLHRMEVQLASGEARVQLPATWLESSPRGLARPDNALPIDGRVSLAAMPDAHLRLALGAAAAPGPAADLALAIADRSHDQGVMGVTAVPGIDALFVALEWAAVDLPVASLALGQDLMRLHGGVYAGPVQRWRTADRRLRVVRPLSLATPLVVGPLRLTPLLVEQDAATMRLANDRGWTRLAPWPDVKGIAGLERELRLPVPLLRSAGCHRLDVDKPARRWTLRCGG